MGNSMDLTGATGGTAPRSSTPNTAAGGGSTQPKQGLKDQALSQAQTLVDQAKTGAQDRVRSAAQGGKASAVDTLSGVAQSLLVAAQQLQDQQKAGVGRIVEQAATRVDDVAKYLDTTEIDELVQRTETWARQNPALFLGGAFVIGVLGARFLKSSRPPNAQANNQQNAWQGGGTAGRFSDREVRPVPSVEGI
jgi:hypothetical protein